MSSELYQPRHARPAKAARVAGAAQAQPARRPSPRPAAEATTTETADAARERIATLFGRSRRTVVLAAVGAAGLAAAVALASSVASAAGETHGTHRPGVGKQLAGPVAKATGAAPAARNTAAGDALTAATARSVVHQRTAPATRQVIAGLAANGIPNVALNAYRVAAARMAHVQPSCGIDWALLAGIGRVESDHGQFGGAVLHPDGTSSPKIIGPALDGTQSAYIAAPANGYALDGDARYTHALGPMQFIPQTWAGYGTDADGDGVANIFDINDAALSAARYLCADGRNLRDRAGQVAAVLAYNHSDAYVAQVLALAAAYRAGVPVSGLPVGQLSGALPPVTATAPYGVNPGVPTAVDPQRSHGTQRPQHPQQPAHTPTAQPGTGTTTTRTSTPTSGGGHGTSSGGQGGGSTPTAAPSTSSSTASLPISVPTVPLPKPSSSASSAKTTPAPSPTCRVNVVGACILP